MVCLTCPLCQYFMFCVCNRIKWLQFDLDTKVNHMKTIHGYTQAANIQCTIPWTYYTNSYAQQTITRTCIYRQTRHVIPNHTHTQIHPPRGNDRKRNGWVGGLSWSEPVSINISLLRDPAQGVLTETVTKTDTSRSYHDDETVFTVMWQSNSSTAVSCN